MEEIIKKAETLADLIKMYATMGHLTFEDLLPLVKKGTSKMMNEPENKIFTPPKEE